MNSTNAIQTCKNCGAPAAHGGVFCGHCGQQLSLHRLTLHEIWHDLLHALFHVDRSLLGLIGALAVRPGTVAADYVSGQRRRYYGPFAFSVITVAMTSAVIAWSGYSAITGDTTNVVVEAMQKHVNLIFFLQLPLLAGLCRLLMARDRFNYAEYLVLAAYTSGMHVLSYLCLVIPVWYVIHPGPALARHLYYAYFPLWPAYFGFAASQFLHGHRAMSFAKGLLAAILTYGATQLGASALVTLYDWLQAVWPHTA